MNKSSNLGAAAIGHLHDSHNHRNWTPRIITNSTNANEHRKHTAHTITQYASHLSLAATVPVLLYVLHHFSSRPLAMRTLLLDTCATGTHPFAEPGGEGSPPTGLRQDTQVSQARPRSEVTAADGHMGTKVQSPQRRREGTNGGGNGGGGSKVPIGGGRR